MPGRDIRIEPAGPAGVTGPAVAGRLDAVFVRWNWTRAALHRGWWLVTSVYLVVDAHLSASRLVLIGVVQAVVALASEVPAGVLADTVSRKWALVVSQVLMGGAMVATALVTGFGPLLATQAVWGLAWTFASGADVAWITDELDDPTRIATVLVRAGRAQLTGAVAGILGVGALALLIGRRPAMVLAGVLMLLLGGYVVARFPERRFTRASRDRWRTAISILRDGTILVRRSRPMLAMFAAVTLAYGAADTVGRLYQLRLVDLGLAVDPVAWFTGLNVLTWIVGAVALRLVQPRIDAADTARRGFAVACGVGVVGLVGLATAPGAIGGSMAILLVAGAMPLTRTFATIWVNRRTAGEVRATVHSLLAQAGYVGDIGCGLAVASAARVAGLPVALALGGVLVAVAIGLVRLGSGRTGEI